MSSTFHVLSCLLDCLLACLCVITKSYRRLGLAKTLMDYFEDISIRSYNAYFVDLFVRASNTLAIKMYEKFGYSTYRRVLGYYSGELPEDALDMRKALPR